MANDAAHVHIEFIKKCLRKGDTKQAILAKFGKKWPEVSNRTFERRYTSAKKAFGAEQKRVMDKVEVEVAKEVDALKLEIMGVMERKAILTQIARGQIPLTKPMVVDKEIENVPVVPDWMDRRAAIAELNKMDGEYAPIKQANTNPDGTPVEPQKVVMTPDQLAELKKSIEGKK